MELLKIAEMGNPVLRKVAKKVGAIDTSILELIKKMKFTVGKVGGVGLAAPQVFHSKRIFVVASKPNVRYPNAPLMEPEAIINPAINYMSDEIVKDWEGCLSIPGIRGLVPRAKSIKVEYTNRNGERVKKQFDGFVARIFQHEFDHIEGIMFLERIESTKDLVTEKEYQRIISEQ
ncbi:MAG TPA: peptide deformylase [Bacteroidales bacterium]|nr:peptide deformylase [Bacteroidales bacterium]